MTIKPELGAGFKDYLPKEATSRRAMLDSIKQIFETFGYLPLETPAIEREEILTGGDPNFNKTIFKIASRGTEDKGLALRFDLTVPLARVVSAYSDEIRKPFKRYQIGSVWRGEKPQAGRYREFIQFDADIVGSSKMMADAEIIALMYNVMKELGFTEYIVRVNNRKILNGLADYASFSSKKTPDVLRSIDKLDKLGWDGVKIELTGTKDQESVGLTNEQADAIKRFLDLRASGHEEVLEAVRTLMPDSPIAMEGVAELQEIVKNAKALGVPNDKWEIDLSVARGLGYYTGPVFETILTNLPAIGSVFSGGRYDDLVSRFSGNNLPATGASVGVDRLFAAMEQLKMLVSRNSVADVMILNFDANCELRVQETATTLRAAGIKTDLYLGQEKTLKGQLSYATSQEIPVVVIIGSDELKNNKVQLKNMAARTQKEVSQEDIAKEVFTILL